MTNAKDKAEGIQDGLGRNTQPEDCLDYYQLNTRTHSDFNVFRTWRESCGTVFPRDLSVTPVTLKSWYVSDGGLQWSSDTSIVKFTSKNESGRPEAIIGSLEKHGFSASNSGEIFYLKTNDTKHFFDLIGDPVPGFEYKWAWRDRDRYKRLKEECREKHCTQTLK